MALYYHKLSNEKYANFLSEGRYDSITKEPFKDGDKVAICSHCKSASLLDVWLAYDKKHCNQEDSEIELNGNIGKRYTRFIINSESIESDNISKNIWHKIIDIFLFIPLVFLLYLIRNTIAIWIFVGIISEIFELSHKSIEIGVGMGMIWAIRAAIGSTNERLE